MRTRASIHTAALQLARGRPADPLPLFQFLTATRAPLIVGFVEAPIWTVRRRFPRPTVISVMVRNSRVVLHAAISDESTLVDWAPFFSADQHQGVSISIRARGRFCEHLVEPRPIGQPRTVGERPLEPPVDVAARSAPADGTNTATAPVPAGTQHTGRFRTPATRGTRPRRLSRRILDCDGYRRRLPPPGSHAQGPAAPVGRPNIAAGRIPT